MDVLTKPPGKERPSDCNFTRNLPKTASIISSTTAQMSRRNRLMVRFLDNIVSEYGNDC